MNPDHVGSTKYWEISAVSVISTVLFLQILQMVWLVLD